MHVKDIYRSYFHYKILHYLRIWPAPDLHRQYKSLYVVHLNINISANYGMAGLVVVVILLEDVDIINLKFIDGG